MTAKYRPDRDRVPAAPRERGEGPRPAQRATARSTSLASLTIGGIVAASSRSAIGSSRSGLRDRTVAKARPQSLGASAAI